MCGIAGLLGKSPKDFAQLVGPYLAHRGPDDSGIWSDNSTCLVHRRLSIIDLSSSGHQPMISSCGRWKLVFNGEIYNYKDLRQELIREGLRFNGSSDTEVLLKWIAQRGRSGLYKLRGMYAFCLYDSEKRTALIARDPNGIKPIYYWHGYDGELVFSSELRALLSSGLIRKELDSCSVEGYLATGSVAEPDTLIKNVKRLPAGHYASWDKGDLNISPWYPIPESLYPTHQITTNNEAIKVTRKALESSISSHLVSDVEIGLFLSAGLDSASILALAPKGLHTFTIGFGEEKFDESEPAAKIAKEFGSEHTPLTLTAMQAKEWLSLFLSNQDQPSIDGYNTWCVSKLASDHGLKVALSGLGGDELFGGYQSFQTIPFLNIFRTSMGSSGPFLSTALRRLPICNNHKILRLCRLLDLPPSTIESYKCFRGIFSKNEVDVIMDNWGIQKAVFEHDTGTLDLPNAAISERDEVAWLEGTCYLRNQLLPDSDVMAMASGLELRLPLVDSELQRQLAGIPSSIRLAPGKSLLRRAVPELPEWFISRPKQGFSFPFQLWLDDSTNPLDISLPVIPSVIDVRPWYRRWSLMVLNVWLNSHLGIELPALKT